MPPYESKSPQVLREILEANAEAVTHIVWPDQKCIIVGRGHGLVVVGHLPEFGKLTHGERPIEGRSSRSTKVVHIACAALLRVAKALD